MKALQEKKIGPRVVVTGSRASGKTTLCNILANYAVKLDWNPLLVDLDTSDNILAPPGHIAAAVIDMPLPVFHLITRREIIANI